MTLGGLIVLRIGFVGLLLLIAFFGVASLIGNPVPFIVTAFSLGGLPAWVFVRRRRLALAVALGLGLVACAVPTLLLIRYTMDGDFTYLELMIQVSILAMFAPSLAYFGIKAGRYVWLSPERRNWA